MMHKQLVRTKRFIAATGLGFVLVLTASAQSSTTTINTAPGDYSRDTAVTGANGPSDGDLAHCGTMS